MSMNKAVNKALLSDSLAALALRKAQRQALGKIMEKLFSYGTLQQKNVQVDTFGRELDGEKDALFGYYLSEIEIKDKAVIKSSGTNIHPILKVSEDAADEVQGTVFEITNEELLSADKYEVAEYMRVSAKLKSGKTTWIYAESKA